jgi:hypothetical protein
VEEEEGDGEGQGVQRRALSHRLPYNLYIFATRIVSDAISRGMRPRAASGSLNRASRAADQ